jgi:hypothetical protein
MNSYPPKILSPIVFKIRCKDTIDGKPVLICKLDRDYNFKDNKRPSYRNVFKDENIV